MDEEKKCMGQCALCTSPNRQCGPVGDFIPKDICSTEIYGSVIKDAMERYHTEKYAKFALNAMRQSDEAHGVLKGSDVRFPCKTRIQETIEFCKRMGYKKIGFAFCGAVHPEATKFCKILQAHGFEVVSVCCKVGKMDKEWLGITPEEKARRAAIHKERMCNPISQAAILNYEKTDFNIVLGLCVGHDSMFLKESEAMVTVLSSKDRLTCNNPMAPLYTCDWHYKRLYNPDAFDSYDENGLRIEKENN